MTHEDMFEIRAESIELLAHIKHYIPYEVKDVHLNTKINELKVATQNELK